MNLTSSRTRAAIAGLALAAALPAAADSIRCPGGIVSTGDSKLDLLAKCGPATLVERQEVKRVQVISTGPAAPAGAASTLASSQSGIETWTYDFGPGRLVQLVTVERGRVVRVEGAGHGYSEPPGERPEIRKATCDPATIDEGDSKLELLATCGEPTLREAWEETRGGGTLSATGGGAVLVTVTVELWTYDFGPNRFIRLFRIEGGRVTDVATGGYGYGR